MNRVSLSMNDERVLEFLRTQHAVKIWVEDVLNIPLVGEDLRFGLKNGVILCYLIQEIEPGSVPTIHENTQQVFKLKENVENFIAGVSEYGVPRHKLFAVNDLFDAANMPRVIECLAWLGKISEDREFTPTFSAALQEAESFDPQMPTGDTLAKLRDQLKQIKEPPRTARKSAFGTPQNNPLSNSDQLKRKLRESEMLAQPTPVVVPSIPKPEIPVVHTIPVVVEPPKKVPEVVVPTIQPTPVTPVTPITPVIPTPVTLVTPVTPVTVQTTPSPPVVVVPTPIPVSVPVPVSTPVPVPTPAVVKPTQPVVPKEQGPSAAELQKLRERQEAEVKKLNSGVSKFQAAFRGWRQRKLYKERRRHAAFRDKVAKELLKTERDYVTSLDACIQNYHKPLHDAVSGIKNKDAKVHIGKDSLTRDQLRAIFSDIHIIWEFNSQLLGDISARVDSWYANQRIGDIFLKMAGVLKIYSNYVQNFDLALRVLDEVKKKDKKISSFLQETRNIPEIKNLDLASFLIMPVQRIPRYNLLLQELLKHTWTDHPDHVSLTVATGKVKDVAAYINEKKREAENQAKVSEVHSVLRGKYQPLYAPGRRLIREAIFPDPKEGDKYVYLFSDVLVWGKPGKQFLKGSSATVKYKDTIPLDTITVTDADAPTPFSFAIKTTKAKYTLVLGAKDAEEKRVWTSDMEMLVKDVGKVKVIGKEETRRDGSKTNLVRDKSRVMRNSTASVMRLPTSPIGSPIHLGVSSAPTTPQSATGIPLSPTLSTSPPLSPTRFVTATPNTQAPSTPLLAASNPNPISSTPPKPSLITPTTPRDNNNNNNNSENNNNINNTIPSVSPTSPTAIATPVPLSPTTITSPSPPIASPIASVPIVSNPVPQEQKLPPPTPVVSTPTPTPVPQQQQQQQQQQQTPPQQIPPPQQQQQQQQQQPRHEPPAQMVRSPSNADQLAKLCEIREQVIKQLKSLDSQPIEKKSAPSTPTSPATASTPVSPASPATTDEAAPEAGTLRRKAKRDVGTIRKMNEQQFRDTVRAQLESELEALDGQIAKLQGSDYTPSSQVITDPQHSLTRRLTPPSSQLFDQPARLPTLQPAKPTLKREDSPPEALKALQRMRASGRDSTIYTPDETSSSVSPVASSPPVSSPPQLSPSHVAYNPFANEFDTNGKVAHMRASTSILTPSVTPSYTTSSTGSSIAMHPGDKDDALGYNKMTQVGIRKHIHMLDRSKLEAYLTTEEFERILGMTRADFNALPKWKQERCKREKALL